MFGDLLCIFDGMIYCCVIDKYWIMILFSDGCKEIIGYSVDEICNNWVVFYEQLIELSDCGSICNMFNVVIVEQVLFMLEYRICCKGGECKWVCECGVVVIDEYGVLVFEGVIFDIMELVEMQLCLVKVELCYCSIFENFVIGMFQMLIDGYYLVVNQVLVDFYCYDLFDELMVGVVDISSLLYVNLECCIEFV